MKKNDTKGKYLNQQGGMKDSGEDDMNVYTKYSRESTNQWLKLKI